MVYVHVCCSPQTDLEMVTEDLAQKVNRPYLRTPRHKIIRAACLVQQKRQEFLASVARGVAPNDSPEAPRRRFLTISLSYFICTVQICSLPILFAMQDRQQFLFSISLLSFKKKSNKDPPYCVIFSISISNKFQMWLWMLFIPASYVGIARQSLN